MSKQVPEETVSSQTHQSWLAERNRQDYLDPLPITDIKNDKGAKLPFFHPLLGFWSDDSEQ